MTVGIAEGDPARQEDVSPAGSSRRSPAPRIASLDLVRGLMLVASVAANSLLAGPEWFEHAPWNGVHPVDLIFPVFVTLSGCGLAFAMHRRVDVWSLVRRVLILFAVGLVYNAITSDSWSFDVWRVTGVLQLYAVVVAVLGVLHLVTKSWVGWAVITAALAAAHSALLAAWSERCPDDLLTRACNPSGAIDSALLTVQHLYQQGAAGHDPEGLVAILGALVSASAGATVGHLLLTVRRRSVARGSGVARAIVPLVALAAGFLALALALVWAPTIADLPLLPVMKRLWTAPFALLVASGTTIALLLGHLLLDRARVARPLRWAAYPALALGRNSLLVYFGSHALMSVLTRPEPDGTRLADQAASTIALFGDPQATWTALALLFWTALAMLLHRHRIYLRP